MRRIVPDRFENVGNIATELGVSLSGSGPELNR